MSRDRFKTVQRFLPFNDDLKDKKRDDETRVRLFTILPIFAKLRQSSLAVDPEEHNSIDRSSCSEDVAFSEDKYQRSL